MQKSSSESNYAWQSCVALEISDAMAVLHADAWRHAITRRVWCNASLTFAIRTLTELQFGQLHFGDCPRTKHSRHSGSKGPG